MKISQDIIEILTAFYVEDALLVIWNSYANGRPGVTSKLFWRRVFETQIRVYTIKFQQVPEQNDEKFPIMESLSVFNQNDRPFYSVLDGVKSVNSVKHISNDSVYIAWDNYKVLEYTINQAGSLELKNQIDYDAIIDTPISNLSVYNDIQSKDKYLIISTQSERHWI